jgi:hypothetical protein
MSIPSLAARLHDILRDTLDCAELTVPAGPVAVPHRPSRGHSRHRSGLRSTPSRTCDSSTVACACATPPTPTGFIWLALLRQRLETPGAAPHGDRGFAHPKYNQGYPSS